MVNRRRKISKSVNQLRDIISRDFPTTEEVSQITSSRDLIHFLHDKYKLTYKELSKLSGLKNISQYIYEYNCSGGSRMSKNTRANLANTLNFDKSHPVFCPMLISTREPGNFYGARDSSITSLEEIKYQSEKITPSDEVLNAPTFKEMIYRRARELGTSVTSIGEIAYGNSKTLNGQLAGGKIPRQSSLKKLSRLLRIPLQTFNTVIKNQGLNSEGYPFERGSEEYKAMLEYLGDEILVLNGMSSRKFAFSPYVVDGILHGTKDEMRFRNKFMILPDVRKQTYDDLVALNPEKYSGIILQKRIHRRTGEREGSITKDVVNLFSRGSPEPSPKDPLEERLVEFEEEYIQSSREVLQEAESKVTKIVQQSLASIGQEELHSSAEDLISMIAVSEPAIQVYQETDKKRKRLEEMYSRRVNLVNRILEERRIPSQETISPVRAEIPQEIRDTVSPETLAKLEARRGISNPVDYLRKVDPRAYNLLCENPLYLDILTDVPIEGMNSAGNTQLTQIHQEREAELREAFSGTQISRQELFDYLLTRPDFKEAGLDSERRIVQIKLDVGTSRVIYAHLPENFSKEYLSELKEMGYIQEREISDSELNQERANHFTI